MWMFCANNLMYSNHLQLASSNRYFGDALYVQFFSQVNQIFSYFLQLIDKMITWCKVWEKITIFMFICKYLGALTVMNQTCILIINLLPVFSEGCNFLIVTVCFVIIVRKICITHIRWFRMFCGLRCIMSMSLFLCVGLQKD